MKIYACYSESHEPLLTRHFTRKILPQMRDALHVSYLPPGRFWNLPHPIPESYDLETFKCS